MAQSILVAGQGTIGLVPNTATLKWLPQYTGQEEIIVTLFEITSGEIEVQCSIPQINIRYEDYNVEGYSEKYLKLILTNTDPTQSPPANKFTLTLRNIDTGVILAIVNINYETLNNNKILEPIALSRLYITNPTYGNGQYLKRKDETVQLGYTTFNYLRNETVSEIKNTAFNNRNPLNKLVSLHPQILSVASPTTANIVTEGNKSVSKAVPTIRSLKEGYGVISYTPTAINSDTKLGPTQHLKYLVRNLSIASRTTRDDPNTNNLAWGTTFIHMFDQNFIGWNIRVGLHKDPYPQGVNDLVCIFDNQQDDILEVTPFVFNGRIGAMIQAKQAVARKAYLGVQLHNPYGEENGRYLSAVYEFNIVPGNNTTPIMVKGSNGEETISIFIGDSLEYTLATPANDYRYVINNDNLINVDKSSKRITGVREGNNYIDFYSSHTSLNEGRARLNVNVKPLPEKTLEINKESLLLAVGQSVSLNINASCADRLTFTQDGGNYVEVFDFTNKNKTNGTLSGRVTIRGLEVGRTQLTITSSWRGVECIQKVVEVNVFERNDWKITCNLDKIKLNIKKNREEQNNPIILEAMTNCYYIGAEYNTNQEAFFHRAETLPNKNSLKYKIFAKTVKGKYSITLYGYNQVGQKLCSLTIPVDVLKNAEIPSNEVWIGLEHKHKDLEDHAEAPYRYFTVIKWTERSDIDQIMNHKIFLPSRSGTLLSHKELENVTKYSKRYYEYASPSSPNRTVNPTKPEALWLDTRNNLVWKCVDNTPNRNAWIAYDGQQIGEVDQLLYPDPGEQGFGAGPMSIDLHEKYGLTPLPGCYDVKSKNYGNYKDEYDNIYVCIPKHYVKLESTPNEPPLPMYKIMYFPKYGEEAKIYPVFHNHRTNTLNEVFKHEDRDVYPKYDKPIFKHELRPVPTSGENSTYILNLLLRDQTV